MTTSSPATGERPKSKPSIKHQKDAPSASQETSVQKKAISPMRPLRSAITPSVRLRIAASTLASERNGSRASGRRQNATARSP
jgi:hypothetical protein